MQEETTLFPPQQKEIEIAREREVERERERERKALIGSFSDSVV